jgi:hypothetical protein
MESEYNFHMFIIMFLLQTVFLLWIVSYYVY